jgi:hypothetical protein
VDDAVAQLRRSGPLDLGEPPLQSLV